jgi:hypothetical protein
MGINFGKIPDIIAKPRRIGGLYHHHSLGGIRSGGCRFPPERIYLLGNARNGGAGCIFPAFCQDVEGIGFVQFTGKCSGKVSRINGIIIERDPVACRNRVFLQFVGSGPVSYGYLGTMNKVIDQ